MKIHNIRLGFATNSSSSHSMIFDPSIQTSDDYDNFGWSFFTLASKEARQEYLAATLYENLSRAFPDTLVKVIMKGLNLPNLAQASWGGLECGIDHQSLYNLPFEFGSKTVSVQFFQEFHDYLMRDGVLILGGNDNDGDAHSLYDNSAELSFGGWEPDQAPYVCRKDGDWWTLYSPYDGHRVTFSFLDNPSTYAPKTPLLMDLKITDYCNHGCAYCYQGSTTEGRHFDAQRIWSYVNLLRTGGVFEVAIGGGEPTQCPSFDVFVSQLNDAGIRANFTTKSIDWLEDEKRADKIIASIGAFAYSAGEYSTQTIERIYAIFKYRGYDLKKFTIQVVPATMSKSSLEQILKLAHHLRIRTTLLGFKETGRGSRFKEIAVKRSWNKFNESEWLDVLINLNSKKELGQISIDTTMASKYEGDLKSSGIPEWMYHIEEGRYSMYLDMVANAYGPSSYHLDKLQKIDGPHSADIEEMFSSIEPV